MMFAYKVVGSHHGHDGTSDDYYHQLYTCWSGRAWKVNSLFIRKTVESRLESYICSSKVS
jgi:hypothetical protein